MSSSAFALALTAAFLHALWNLLLAGASDSECATAVALFAAVVFVAPLAAITGDVQTEALPYIAGSSGLELLYFALLGAAYRRAEMSVVYPLSRGLAPVLVLVIAVAALGGRLSAFQVAAVVLVGLGVMLVRDVRRLGDARDLTFSLAIAVTIAGYTLIDKQGLRYADPIAYFELVLIVPAVVYLGAIAYVRGMPALRAAIEARTAVAALGMFGAYLLVLAALEQAPAAPVAAIRESSVVIATALAAAFLGEAVGPKRLIGSALVAGGVAVLALV